MELEITADAHKETVARLGRVLDGLVENTGRSSYQSVMFATVRACESARADSKPSPKIRKVVDNPFFKMRKRYQKLISVDSTGAEIWAKYRYMVRFDFANDGLGAWWYTNDKNDPKREIKKSGLARNIWNVLSAKAAETKSCGTFRTGDYHTLAVFTNPNVVHSRIHNELNYLERAFPGQGARALLSATKKLENDLARATQANVAIANAGQVR